MKILKALALRGPNYWANFPVLEAWVDLENLENSPSDELPGFNERLKAWLPTLIEHRCSEGHRGGFFERLRRGTWMAHILEHVTIELQSLAGSDVTFGRARETEVSGVYRVAIEYEEEALVREALAVGYRLCLAAVADEPFDVAVEVERLREIYHEVKLGPSTGAIVAAAQAKGIPYRRLNEGSLVQFGYGVKQRRILAAETDRTSAVAESIAQDKQLTRTLLTAVGLPAPKGRPVVDADDAWRAACELGLPVVVKPLDGNQGRGVATNLATEEQVRSAYEAARAESSEVLVEQFLVGGDYRLLVVGDKMVAAAHREPARVVGDGVHTIRQLVEIVNRDPRRQDGHASVLSKIPLDAVSRGVLADQGYTEDSIPPAGKTVLIRRNANLSTGGTATDVTDFVHPDIAEAAVEAAKVVGLDVAGVDIVVADIGRPLASQAGGIVEVNASPGLRMHIEPSSGRSRPVGEAIVELLYPGAENGRIPIVAVSGVNGKTTVTRLIEHIVRQAGLYVGMTCTDGVYLNGVRRESGDCSGPVSARSVLMNRKVEAAVFETARGGILREGLGFDQCDVAVVTNIGAGDHLGLGGIDTIEKLVRVKETIVRAVAREGSAILNADDPLVAGMAENSPGKVVYFSRNEQNPLIVTHRAENGRAVFVRDGVIVAADGATELTIARLDRAPITHGGRIPFQVENALAACAAVWQLGVPVETIRIGLETFAADLSTSPGRFNLLDVGGATVIVDYGHNTSALQALLDALQLFPHKFRGVVYSAAGDRRDDDMRAQGELIGKHFDRVVLYEDKCLRGRKDGEIMRLLREGMAGSTRVCEVHEIRGALAAVETALQLARPGELWLVQADLIDETMEHLRRLSQNDAAVREISLTEAIGTGKSEVVVAKSNNGQVSAPNPTRA